MNKPYIFVQSSLILDPNEIRILTVPGSDNWC